MQICVIIICIKYIHARQSNITDLKTNVGTGVEWKIRLPVAHCAMERKTADRTAGQSGLEWTIIKPNDTNGVTLHTPMVAR